MGALALRGYYAIVDLLEDRLPADGGEEVLGKAGELLAAGPCCLQLRAKKLPATLMHQVAERLLPLCRAAGVPFCVNDRIDVALAVGADAVHLGQDDLPLGEARRLLAGLERHPFIGVSTHDLGQARAAAAAGADYIGFGPVFPTGSKANPDPVVGIVGLRAACAAVQIPVVAIGGITRQRAPSVAAAGASAAAVISDVDQAPNRTAAALEVKAAFG